MHMILSAFCFFKRASLLLARRARLYSGVVFVVFFAQPVLGATDPLKSPLWAEMHKEILQGSEVRFSEQVKVYAPDSAEDSMNVPVTVDTTELSNVEEVVIFADLNPIKKILSFVPVRANSILEFRIKLQQSTPVRAAAKTSDGVWHVGGVWVNTFGGGCTAPSLGRGQVGWEDRLGKVNGRLWPRGEAGDRLRVHISHPMDTGLAPGIPAFYIQRLNVLDAQKQVLMKLELHEPVSENPVFTFQLRKGERATDLVLIDGEDNNGNRIKAQVNQ